MLVYFCGCIYHSLPLKQNSIELACLIMHVLSLNPCIVVLHVFTCKVSNAIRREINVKASCYRSCTGIFTSDLFLQGLQNHSHFSCNRLLILWVTAHEGLLTSTQFE